MPAFRVRLHLGLQSRLPLLQRSLLLSAVNIVIYTIFYIVQTLIFRPICFVQAMPPVKRPRAARPSTRAAKKSRPAGPPPEADVPPERTSTPNSGMINLNLEALSATISAAVQQAVQNAVTSTSTSVDSPSSVASTAQVSETVVSQAIESEVSTMTSTAGQIPFNNEGTGSRPATDFCSVAISLAARVSSKIKAKIWAQEYIDFGSLLSLSPSSNSYSLSLKANNEISSVTPKLFLEPNEKPRRIFHISQWLTAFNTFVSVYTERFPQKAPQLMKYCETVRDISAKGGDWRYYDEQFRFLRQSDPNLFPWDQIHWELWFQTMFTSRNKSHSSSSDREKPPNRFRPQFPKGTCWAFHAGKTCTGCKFEHICFKCGSRHPASQCPSHKGKSKTALASEQADRLKPQTNNSGKSA